MLRSTLVAFLAMASLVLAQTSTERECPGSEGGSNALGRRHNHAHEVARRAAPSGCAVRCNPTGINGRVLTLEDSATQQGVHYTCQYDLPGGGALVSCYFHNHNYEDPNYSDTFWYNNGPGTPADCPAKLQMSCGGSAYARRSKRRPLDALLKREKMGEVPADLKERRKVWKGKKAA